MCTKVEQSEFFYGRLIEELCHGKTVVLNVDSKKNIIICINITNNPFSIKKMMLKLRNPGNEAGMTAMKKNG